MKEVKENEGGKEEVDVKMKVKEMRGGEIKWSVYIFPCVGGGIGGEKEEEGEWKGRRGGRRRGRHILTLPPLSSPLFRFCTGVLDRDI